MYAYVPGIVMAVGLVYVVVVPVREQLVIMPVTPETTQSETCVFFEFDCNSLVSDCPRERQRRRLDYKTHAVALVVGDIGLHGAAVHRRNLCCM